MIYKKELEYQKKYTSLKLNSNQISILKIPKTFILDLSLLVLYFL